MNSQADDARSVSELITGLKHSFLDEEFEEVERILSAREGNLRAEIARWEQKYGALEIKHGEMTLAKLQVEGDLQKAEQELGKIYEDLTERVIRAEEFVKSVLERHSGGSKKVAESVPEKKRVDMERTSSRNESVAEISRENSVPPQVRVKEESECSRIGGFGSPHSSNGEASGLGQMGHGGPKKVVQSMPEKQPEAMGKAPENGSRSETGPIAGSRTTSVQPQVKKEPQSSQNGGFGSPLSPGGEGRHSVLMNCSNAKPSQKPLDSKAGTCGEARGTTVAAGTPVSAPVIEIDDSDEEMENCVPNIAASGGVSCAEVKSVQIDENGRTCNQISLRASSLKRKRDDISSSDDGSSSDGDLYGADKVIASLGKRVKPQTSGKRIKLWTSCVDMTLALIKNEGVRISAVCALYRQLTSNVKSASSCSWIKQSDALSIRKYGRYLTEGDPQGKLNKSVEQLKLHDPEGVTECYKLSLEYSDQLYEIYEKDKDPFFPLS